MIKVSIKSSKFEHDLQIVQNNLLLDANKVPYCAHFYKENTLVIVFPLKIFFVTCAKTSWDDDIDYGKS